MTRGLLSYLLFGTSLLGLYGGGGYAGWWHSKPRPPGAYGTSPTPYVPGTGGYAPTGGYGGGHGSSWGGGSSGSGGGFRGGK